MMNNKSFLKQYIIINSSFTILKGILFSIAMLMKPNNRDNPTAFPEDKLKADWNDNPSLRNLN